MSGMDVIVVGGCADGSLLNDVRMDAEFIELRRPDYVKPLASAAQAMPEIMHESDRYEVHVIGLQDSEAQAQTVFGIAVVEGRALTWGFTQLILSHIQLTTRKLKEAGLIEK